MHALFISLNSEDGQVLEFGTDIADGLDAAHAKVDYPSRHQTCQHVCHTALSCQDPGFWPGEAQLRQQRDRHCVNLNYAGSTASQPHQPRQRIGNRRLI